MQDTAIKCFPMKSFILLLLIASLSASGQNHEEEINEKRIDQLLNKLHAQQATEEDRNELQKIAQAVQERAQWLEGNARDYKKAMLRTDRAIILYEALGDSLNLAFTKRNKGLLLVRMSKTAAAKTELRAAVQLYRLTNTGAGAAAAQLDLARLFEYETKQDSAIYYAEQSRSYWKGQQDNLQIIVINSMLVYHLLQLNKIEKAQLIYNESKLLLAKQPVHWQPLLDFYFTSMLLFRQTNDTSLVAYYQDLYFNKVEALKTEGIAAPSSYYENYGQ